MPLLFWDASGLVKRYYSEAGSATVNSIFDGVSHSGDASVMISTFWGYTETYAILARKRNSGVIKTDAMANAMSALFYEVAVAEDFLLLSIDDETVMESVTHILSHNINSADAALLTAFLDYQASLPEGDPPCILVTADLRLTRAAQAEGLQTLNPEALTPQEASAFLASFR